MNVDWTPYDPEWVYLAEDDPRLAAMSEADQALYKLYSYRNFVRQSPLHFALAFTPGAEEYAHIVYLSARISELIEDRLILPNGEVAQNLVITMPPRHGKSYLSSEHTPAWFLSRFPNLNVILTSYEADFAAQWGKKAKDLIRKAGPVLGLEVDPESKSNSRWNLNGFRGGMQTAGTGGPITGKGAELLIGDDWVKNSEEANSPAWREKAWDWVLSTFLTRRNPGAKTVLLMTRWNDDDPVGRLLKQEPDQWYHVDLPAISREGDPLGREPGEALSPERYPLPELQKVLKTMGPYWFSALYQGRPTPEDGGLFNEGTFRYYRSPSGSGNEAEGRTYAPGTSYVLLTPDGQTRYLSKREGTHFVTVDLAVSEKRTADYTVFASWFSSKTGELLLTGLWRDRIIGPEHLDKLEQFVGERRLLDETPAFVGIETATFGLTLIQDARRHASFLVRELAADKDKVSRAIPASVLAKDGRLYLPKDATWLPDWQEEHAAFPNGGHDDQVDTTAYAAHVHTQLLSFRDRKRRDPQGVRTSTSMAERLANHADRITQRRRDAARRARNRGV